MLSEISQRQIRYDITYMWNLKTETSEYNKKETDSQIENKLVVTGRERQVRKGKIGVGD